MQMFLQFLFLFTLAAFTHVFLLAYSSSAPNLFSM